MNTNWKNLLSVCLAFCTIATGHSAKQNWKASPYAKGTLHSLTVVIFDEAPAARAVLVKAADEARNAFRITGLETSWMICPLTQAPNQDCDLPPDGTYLEVRILPKASKEDPPTGDTLGKAMRCPADERCATSWVFYDAVLEFQQHAEQPTTVVLAYVMVHEVGHLLGLEHARCGIMKAHFDRRDLQAAAAGRFRFQADEATRLRAAIADWTGSATAIAEIR